MKNRNEIDIKYTWNTNDIYKNHDEFLDDIEVLKKLNKQIVSMKGKICDSSETLEEYFKLEEKISVVITKLYSYATFLYSISSFSYFINYS